MMATFTAVKSKTQTAGAMANVMEYVTQTTKTMLGDRWLVTENNCVAQSSYLEMTTTKQRFRKTDGRQFYHFVPSFSEDDELTPEEVNAIWVELAQREFPDSVSSQTSKCWSLHTSTPTIWSSTASAVSMATSCIRTPPTSSNIGKPATRYVLLTV